MKKYLIMSFLFLTLCTTTKDSNVQTDPFMKQLIGNTYNTWTYFGDLITDDIYTIQENGAIIHYANVPCNISYNYYHIQTLQSNQAIYLQKSSVNPLYFALILSNNGKDIYQAENFNAANTNDIDWNSSYHFIKVP